MRFNARAGTESKEVAEALRHFIELNKLAFRVVLHRESSGSGVSVHCAVSWSPGCGWSRKEAGQVWGAHWRAFCECLARQKPLPRHLVCPTGWHAAQHCGCQEAATP